jgi:hypothetical protein
VKNIGIFNFRYQTESLFVENCLVFVDFIFVDKPKFIKFFQKQFLCFRSHFFFILEAVSKVSLALFCSQDEGESLETTSRDLFVEFDSIRKTKFAE